MNYRQFFLGLNRFNGVDYDGIPASAYIGYENPYENLYKLALESKEPATVSTFLNKWNPRVPFTESRLRELIISTSAHIQVLRATALERTKLTSILKVDDMGMHLRDVARSLFDQVKSVLKPTGASKFLHVLLPDLFVMWDNKIRYSYGCADNAEGYYNFLVRSKEELREAIQSFSNHAGTTFERGAERIRTSFYVGGWKPLTKLLDEYNYMKYTKVRL